VHHTIWHNRAIWYIVGWKVIVPRQREWYQRVPKALTALRALPCPVVDRGALEVLLGLGRRQAIRLMAEFGGYQSGKTYLVDRESLIEKLESIRQGNDYNHDKARRRRVAELAERFAAEWEARRTLISPPHKKVRSQEDLPESVRLEEGRLEIRFTNREDLLTQLLALAQAFARDVI
jgi:hypothetical protein